ncbi:SDR family NAD(P)-dependent oxidoreductase [Herbidospora mongoliensis]|uniref:SDR family NAD(P)-dependent oxidoreductase n=1 Tax=Herbidospora mongoliensis TaxID=688067 RepID=UPI00082DFFB4|nr:SDR family oxidoreductase [Herbidospora mongoliensis]
MLQDKNAIIYGAGGMIGSAVAEEFARQGARVFLTGRTREPLEALAKTIDAEFAVVDAFDEVAVDAHAAEVAARGGIDISLNLVPRGDVQGTPLIDMSVDDLLRPVENGLRTTFITARAAARHMTRRKRGVILTLDSGSGSGVNSPMMGGTGPADAAIDTFVRNLAYEIGADGVRVLGVWVAGIPETFTPEKLAAVNPDIALDETAMNSLLEGLAQMRMLKRSPRLAEVASTIAFLASDHAAGITASFVNVTGGIFPS